MDPGGYFIINGSEKTCLGQERAAENQVQCFNISKNNSKWEWLAEIKSVPDFKCISPKQISLYISSKSNGYGKGIYLQIPRIKNPIPLFIIYRALGVISDEEICKHIVLDTNNDNELIKKIMISIRGSIVDANTYLTKEEALKYITSHAMYTPLNMDKETGARKKLEFTINVLTDDLFPHCRTHTQKLYFLGYMANRLICCSLGINKPDDRDSSVSYTHLTLPTKA